MAEPQVEKLPEDNDSASDSENITQEEKEASESAADFEIPVGFQEFIFTNATFTDWLVQLSSSTEPKYYVETSNYKLGKPDLTIHSGNLKTGTIVGVCKVGHSSEKKIGLGDPDNNLNSVQWETFQQHGRLINLKYTFDIEFGNDGQRKSFTWRRVSRYPEHYKLHLDGKESELLGEYSGNWLGKFGKGRERGKLAIAMGNSEKWEFAVLLTVLTMVETTRRRVRRIS